MSTDAFLSLFEPRDAHEPRDPMKAAQGSMRTALPRRFYTRAAIVTRDGTHHLELDGKRALTPARKPLAVDSSAVAEALAAEWNAQVEVIDPARMPLTRLVNAAIDGVAAEAEAVRAEVARYAGSDLICYRAETPVALAERQTAIWDPLVLWAREALGARLRLAAGVIHVAQDEGALLKVRAAVDTVPSPFAIAALSTATTLGGSAIIALALFKGRLTADEAWAAAHVDEAYQSEIWGVDEEARERLAHRRREFDAAALVLTSPPDTTL